ncbi:MAG: phosphonate ABC transporter, permease protein PhnE [Lachnospiraceae bacterium]|nr:phosphonate ABC transporter, permease protein PhnE [Lachnospiraceae bacterium]
MNDRINEKLNQQPRAWIKRLLTVVVVAIILIWSSTSVEYKGMSANGTKLAGNILKGITSPSTDILFNLSTGGVPYLLLETVCIALLGTIIGAVVSIPISFIASSRIMPKPIAWVGSTLIMLIRTIPAIIYGLMVIRVTGPGAFAGLLTMSICSIGMISKMYIEAIENLDISILDSMDAAGCTGFQKIRYGILPQLFASFMSTAIYRFDINLKDATVLGLVGAGGIGAPLIFAMNSYRWNDVGALLLGLIILVLVVEYFSTKIRTKLVRG